MAPRATSAGKADLHGGRAPSLALGRHAELKFLSDTLAQAKDGLGALVLLLGPSGIGKSHLLAEGARVASELGFEVHRGYAIEGWTAPFFLLEQLLPGSDRATGPGPSPSGTGETGRSEAQEGAHAPPGNPEVPRPAALMAMAAAAVALEEDEDPAGASGSAGSGSDPGLEPEGPASLRDALPIGLTLSRRGPPTVPEATALLSYLRRLESRSRHAPQLLILDDLQWADLASLQGARFLCRNARHLPVVVLAAARYEGPGGTGAEERWRGIEDLIDEAKRSDPRSVLRLASLPSRAAFRLAEAVLGGPVATPAESRPFKLLLERSGGNPLLLSEMLREMQREGFARRERGRWTLIVPPGWEGAVAAGPRSTDRVPPALARVLLSRLVGLPPTVREALRTAALLGARFDSSEVAGALSRPTSEVESDLSRLSGEGGLLVRLGGSGGGFAFAHALLWQTVVEEMPAPERAEGARRLAEWLTKQRPGDAPLLARLWKEAGIAEEALRWTRQAMELALTMQDAEAFERWNNAWVEVDTAQGAPATSSVAERFALVQRMVRSIGVHPVVRRLLARLLEEAPHGPLRWEIAERLAWMDVVRAPKEGRAELERLSRELGSVPKGPSPEVSQALRGRLALTWTNLLIREGNVPKALEKAQEAQRLLEGTSERWELGRASYCAGWCLAFQERQTEAQQDLARALAVARELDDARLLGLALELQGMLASLRGAVQESRAVTLEALEQYRRSGSVNNIVITLGNVANVEADLGEMDLAWGRSEEMLALARRFDLKRGIALAAQRQGDILALARRPGEARDRFSQALEIYLELGDRESTPPLQLRLARAEAETGAAENALRRIGEVERGLHGSLSPSERYLAGWARSLAKAVKEPASAVQASFEEAREEAHAARNPFAEAEVVWAQSEWAERTGAPAGTVRALRAAAEQLWRSSGVDPRRREAAHRWNGPAPAVRGTVSPPPHRGGTPPGARAQSKAPLAQKILEHLARHQGSGSEELRTAAPALTQGGISRALGLPQARFAKTLSRLQERGLVVAEVRPIEGHGRRLKAYRTTPAGLSIVAERARTASG